MTPPKKYMYTSDQWKYGRQTIIDSINYYKRKTLSFKTTLFVRNTTVRTH